MQKIFITALSAQGERLRENETASNRKAPLFEAFAKRGFDVGAASTALLLLLPLLLTLALLMMLIQGRPVLVRQNRVGRKGVLFGCLKFRTMTVNADELLRVHLASDAEAYSEWNATRKLKVDPRITPLGQVMRKLSVDELPQFLNILRGEMSLVGPRPIVADEIMHYGTRIELYHSVRPGLTGSWQIGGRNDVSYSRRVEMDAEYVENWTFWRDITILVKTVPAVLTAKGCY